MALAIIQLMSGAEHTMMHTLFAPGNIAPTFSKHKGETIAIWLTTPSTSAGTGRPHASPCG